MPHAVSRERNQEKPSLVGERVRADLALVLEEVASLRRALVEQRATSG